jgi:ribosomal protein L2
MRLYEMDGKAPLNLSILSGGGMAYNALDGPFGGGDTIHPSPMPASARGNKAQKHEV